MSQRYIEGPAKASVPISYGAFTGIVCGSVLGLITADAPFIGGAVGHHRPRVWMVFPQRRNSAHLT